MIRLDFLAVGLLLASCAGVGPIETVGKENIVVPWEGYPRKYGIALAGGGTKAAAYSMGVLSAATKDVEVFRETGAISSVSGGGYAAFFLYTKLLWQKAAKEEHLAPGAFFRDCVPAVYREDLASVPGTRLPSSDFCTTPPHPKYRFQQWVRCRQDILEQTCDTGYGGFDFGMVANTSALLAQTILAIVPNFIARSVFDWPVNLAPSRVAYRQGIGTAYGLYPRREWSGGWDVGAACRAGEFVNCRTDATAPQVEEEGQTWEKFKAVQKPGGNVPLWVTNMTGARSRSVFGWARDGRRNFTLYPIRQSVQKAFTGYRGVIAFDEEWNLLDSLVSGAAFFDSNANSAEQPTRMALAILQHLLALDWGGDVRNPRAEAWRQYLHPVLPFPLYYLDGTVNQLFEDHEQAMRGSGAYIRLIDGGNDDNLGAFTLIDAGFQTIFIADHAFDAFGEMEDVCRLARELERLDGSRRKRLEDPRIRKRRLHIPGLLDLPTACKRFECSLEPEETSQPTSCDEETAEAPRHYYPVWAWKHPFLLGCVTRGKDCESDVVARVVLLKPALDLCRFQRKQVRDAGLAAMRGNMALKACGGAHLLPCETSAYLLRKLRNDPAGVPAFPQDATVAVTLDSDGLQYGAYRDLAEWHMQSALRAVRDLHATDHAGFIALMDKQKKDPIRPSVLPFDKKPTDSVKRLTCER